MGFWTLKPTISEFHQNFTRPSSISPPSYSVGIFQISQPPSPQKFPKGGGVCQKNEQKLTTSEFLKNFTGPSSISPPSYSVGIFQISQPPFPPEIPKGGWGRWVFGP